MLQACNLLITWYHPALPPPSASDIVSMAGKYLVQLVIAGAQVIGRAFSRALREELAASQEAARRRAAASNGSSSFSSNAQSAESDLRHGITLEEAIQILNVDKKLDPEDVASKFKHLFEVNDKSKGGSFYIQSKVVRAKERIDQELEKAKDEGSETSDPR